MNVFRLSICLGDEALASALARAVAKEYPYVEVFIGEEPLADFTIRDEFLGAPAPVREIMDRVLAASGKDFGFENDPSSCLFTAFTAGGGGRGTSSCAKAYGRVRAGQEGKTVLLLGFDPYYPPTDPQAGMNLLRCAAAGGSVPLKASCIPDSFGLYTPAQSTHRNLLHEMEPEEIAIFLENVENSGEWDEVVLDVPRACSCWRQIMNMCERRIVVYSDRNEEAGMDEAAYQELNLLKEPETMLLRFAPQQDPYWDEGTGDLYGPLGSEVKALAQELASC